MTNLIFLFLITLVSFSFGLPRPNANLEKSASSSSCPKGPIAIAINGNKNDYEKSIDRKRKMQTNNKIYSYNDFETEAKRLLSQSFSNSSCKVSPDQIQLNLEERCNSKGEVRKDCVNEIIGPDFKYNAASMSQFKYLIFKTHKNCDKVGFPYIKQEDSRVISCDPAKKKSPTKSLVVEQKAPKRDLSPFRFKKTENNNRGNEESSNPYRNQSPTEGMDVCLDCLFQDIPLTNNLSRVIEQAKDIKLKVHNPVSCEPPGYEQGMSEKRVKEFVAAGKMNEIINRYSDRAQGAIKRSFLALVKPDPESMAKARKLTHNFESFAGLSESQLKEILYDRADKNCYKTIKAALSGDYSVLIEQKHKGEGVRVNEQLLAEQCNVGRTPSKGDLAISHRGWRKESPDYSSYAAGNSGTDLKKLGFINILENKYGVAKNYLDVDGRVDENLLPEGALVVYQCNEVSRGNTIIKNKANNFSNFSNPYRGKYSNREVDRCMLGDIAIKTEQGYNRSYYGNIPISRSAKRVVVGVYIKPTE